MKRLQQSDFGSNCFVKGVLYIFSSIDLGGLELLSNLALGVPNFARLARKCQDLWQQS